MEIFFADDSNQKAMRQGMGDLVAFGGIFVGEDFLRPLARSVDAIAADAGVPEDEELKWSPKKNSWIHKNLVGDARRDCYVKVLDAAAEHLVSAYVIVWDTGRTSLQGERAFAKCVEYLFDRLMVYLDKKQSQGLIVADRPGGGQKEDTRFLADFLEHTNYGTDYVSPERVGINVLTTPSHLVRHLQVADLITGITTAMVAGNYKYAKPLFSHVLPLYERNAGGSIGGTGLKTFPNEIRNLYYWVLGERSFVRVGEQTGHALPHSQFVYDRDEFTDSV